ncbi:hypothetical protein GKZ90_0014350 [Flavobacterium sp. MC2016-06]|jgi:hypothetical protein|uniref:hypothetical protein n=1 Tax=Flavobacterium sp. MC2016-06 TaxID=2676308 RepID=UPI0012BA6BDA|nr:hypothetical protein [Flavobacterium sp. MC2016-06]MBU3859199.1 hypothetical protein [Flavobacterium sp. MC2016-06]
MKSNFISSISKIFILASLFFSCSSDLDFNQVNDLKLEPVIVANLAYFNLPAAQIQNGQQIPPDVESFDIFRRKFFTEHLKKAALDFEIENTISKAFALNIIFIDVNNQPIEAINLIVPAYTSGTNVIKYPTEVFEGERLERLKKATQIGFEILMTSGTPASNDSGNLKLKSSATVYMEIE